MIAASSLTLTLSRWERELTLAAADLSGVLRVSDSRSSAEMRPTLLPLPAGEGRGEGEAVTAKERLHFNLNRTNLNPEVAVPDWPTNEICQSMLLFRHAPAWALEFNINRADRFVILLWGPMQWRKW
jgi:hypothetical protein